MRLWRLIVVVLALMIVGACGSGDADDDASGSTDVSTDVAIDLAPELVSIGEWHNSEPLTLAALRGNPVLLVFWRDT